MNLSLLIIAVSITVQVLSAAIAIRLISQNRTRAAGTIMLIAVILMIFRRSISFYHLLTGNWVEVDLFAEVIACIIAIMVLGGFIFLSRLFAAFHKEVSDHARAANSLQEANQALNALISNSPLAIIHTDVDSNVLIWNPAAERIFGWKEEEVAGRKNPIVPDGKQEEHRHLREYILQGRLFLSREIVRQRKDGTLVRLNAASAAVRDADGKTAALLGIFEDITERKRVEEALGESEKKYRELVEHANSIILTLDINGNVTFFNTYAEHFFGFDAGEILGRCAVGTIVPTDESTGRDLSRLMKEICADPDRFSDSVNENITRDGRRVWVRWANRAIRDNNGKLVGVLSIGNDITAHRRDEQWLQLLKYSIDMASDAAYWLNKEGRFLFANEAGCRSLGYSLEEMLQLNVSDINPRVTPQRWAEVCQLFREKKVFTSESIHRRKDGSVFPVEVSSTYVRFGADEFFSGFARDITERKRADDSINRLLNHIELILNSAGEGIYGIDLSGNLTFLNHAAAKMIGRPAEELVVGKSIHLILHHSKPDGSPYPQDECPVHAVRQDGIVRHVSDEVFWRADGTSFPVEYTAAPIREHDRVVGTVVVFSDISGRRQAETDLRVAVIRARQEKAKTEAIIAALGDAINILDTNYTVLYQNQIARNIYGDCAGKYCYQAFQNRDRVCDVCHLTMAYTDGGIHTLEQRRDTDQGTAYYEITASPVRDVSGEIVAGIELIRDITERKHAEEALRNRERSYRLLFESNPHPMWIYDRNTLQFLAVNGAAIGHYGYSPEEFLSMTIKDIRPEEDIPLLLDTTTEIASGHYTSGTWRHRRKDGRIIDVEITSHGLEFDGRQARVVLALDVTARKQAVEALGQTMLRAEEEKSKSEAIIAALADQMVIIDPGFRVIYQNNFATEKIGNHVGEICYKAFEKRDVVCEGCPVALTFKDGQVHRGERLAASIVGTMHLDITSSPLRNASGTVIGAIEMVRDITDRKHTEEALRRSHDDLAVRVEERTAELTMLTGQLRSLTEHLHKVREEERTKIAREIHDDLGQSLTALNMDLSFLQKNMPPGQAVLNEKLTAMATLIGMTMQSVRRISTDLRPGILDVLGLPAALEWQAGEYEKRTGIAIAVTCGTPELAIDRDRATTIFRIFQETLSNIARHADATKVTVTLHRDREALVLRVKDNGKGIGEKQMSKPKSFGLIGMRERALAWGGEVTIRNSRAGGTTVTVRIPMDSKGKTA